MNEAIVQGVTNHEGLARLRQPFPERRAVFDLAASMPGFATDEASDIDFGPCSSGSGGCCAPRYMQVQLEVAAAGYLMPTHP